MTSLHYQFAIIRAEASGFPGFATALRSLYLRAYPITVPPAPNSATVQLCRQARKDTFNHFQRGQET